MLLEAYDNRKTNPPGLRCERRRVHPNIIVGGNINDLDDALRLRDVLGAMAVISIGCEDESFVPLPILQCSLADVGERFPKAEVQEILSFASQHAPKVLYVHCHLGRSRSPAIAYGILRWCYRLNSALARATIRETIDLDWFCIAKHEVYVTSIEDAMGL